MTPASHLRPNAETMNPEIARLASVRIQGFRSLADVTLRPGPGVTVLIGPNGAGKSNFFRFFEMVRAMVRQRKLARFVSLNGGADDQLFRGAEYTPRMKAEFSLEMAASAYDYAFTLERRANDRFDFTDERLRSSRLDARDAAPWFQVAEGDGEAGLVFAARTPEHPEYRDAAEVVADHLEAVAPYQFHHTTPSSGFHIHWDSTDSVLRGDGGNLASVLYVLRRKDNRRYEGICRSIGRILPNFEEFVLEEQGGRVLLRWKARGSAKTMGAHLTSDGSLRLFALMTLLKTPRELLPRAILLDEPELGLHPAAIAIVGGMIRSLAHHRQVIVATQSPTLVDEFGLDEIQVLELEDGQTRVRTIASDDYGEWLEEYSTGELWQKNLLGGQP